MKFQGQVKRRNIFRKRKKLPLLFLAIIAAVVFMFYYVNTRLTPIYIEYAAVQTEKIASHVINQAISERIVNILDINDVIEKVPTENSNSTTVKFNTEVINRIAADVRNSIEENLDEVEKGNLDKLPLDENIEYDPLQMEAEGGVIFFVPLAQAANLPILGNLGPKIPIRFHILGDAQVNVVPYIEEFGINNAYVEVNVMVKVQVQIIIPLATKSTVIEQKIPVAIGLVQGPVPNVFSSGDGGMGPPSIEVPLPPESED